MCTGSATPESDGATYLAPSGDSSAPGIDATTEAMSQGESEIFGEVRKACVGAKRAARILAPAGAEQKDLALRAMARALEARAADIVLANEQDLKAAERSGISAAMLDRLRLDRERIQGVKKGVLEIVELPDPVGVELSRRQRPSGILVRRVAVPIGVVAMVYEARPNVTVEAAALTLKAGNAVVLRGGSESIRTNTVLAEVVGDALEEVGLPREVVTVLTETDRAAVKALLEQVGLVDLAIPRGGEALIRFVTDCAKVPVVQHYKGVCHLYLDAGCDLEMAKAIAVNAKLQRPAVCNALECILVDRAEAERLVPAVTEVLTAGGCEVRGCAESRRIHPALLAATDEDWGREYLDRVCALRIVEGLEGAMGHIAEYGSGHTEAIVTSDPARAARFQREVDAACVVVNASTRFHDGSALGLGAEMGIATSRLHWRGPMGLEALTTMKWVVEGHGEVRA